MARVAICMDKCNNVLLYHFPCVALHPQKAHATKSEEKLILVFLPSDNSDLIAVMTICFMSRWRFSMCYRTKLQYELKMNTTLYINIIHFLISRSLHTFKKHICITNKTQLYVACLMQGILHRESLCNEKNLVESQI
jgi:hypothetical protein